ncbi:MAG: M28 family metallopeptidase [Candidatus Brocadiales bacterium]
MLAFDAQKAYEYAGAIAMPRRTGSPGEAEAASYITGSLRGFGLDVREDWFSFTTVLRQFMRLTILSILLMLFFIFFLFYVNPFLTGIVVTLMLLLLLRFLSGVPFVATLKGLLFRDIPFTRRQESRNITATVGEGDTDKNPHIYILAHYDSKSQSLSLVYRIVLMGVFFLGSIYILGHYIIAALVWGTPGGWLYAVYCLTNFSGILLLLMVEGNYSPGAVDNASGVGVLLHLAEIISRERKQFRDVDITFVATGAEEEALVGAFHLCKALTKDSVSKGRSYFINLDGVGIKGGIYCTHKIGLHFTFTKGQSDFVVLVKEAGKKEGLEIKTPPVVFGAAADHFPFVYEGFNAVTLSTISKKSQVVHTPKDVMDQIELEGLDSIGRLVLGAIEGIKDRQT